MSTNSLMTQRPSTRPNLGNPQIFIPYFRILQREELPHSFSIIMRLEFTTVDVFTKTRYVGNPLGIVRVPASLRDQLSEEQKQKIAREFNLSEITFLHEPTKDSDTADYDIFTPFSRMTFAGHPTIGTSIYVAQHAAAYPRITKLRTIAGIIPFKFESGKATVSIPHDVYTHKACLPHPIEKKDSVPVVSIVKGMAFGLSKLPDLDALGRVNGPLIPSEVRYKQTFLDAGSGWDIGYTGSFYYVDMEQDPEAEGVRLLRTRMNSFTEDPGTGSASAALCSHLALTEGAKGTARFHLIQGVEMGRRCDIFVDVVMRDGGEGIEDVRLSGCSVEVMEGSLVVE
jgi:predicted PhzF superfamily epimerase YddE/YHI9